MKKLYTQVLYSIVFLILYLSTPLHSHAGNYLNSDKTDDISDGYYLILGAFQNPVNAMRYARHLQAKGKNTEVALNAERQLYYVYADYSQAFEPIKQKWETVRKEQDHADAWVYYKGNSPDPFFKNQAGTGESSSVNQIRAQPSQSTTTDPVLSSQEVEETKAPVKETPPEPEGKSFKMLFNPVNATTLKEVPGTVIVVDAERNKEIGKFDSHRLQYVPDPNNRTNRVLIICDIFGFVKQQVELVLDKPEAAKDPRISVQEGVTHIDLDLVRHDKGALITMYNVFFFNDAAVMRPESLYEMNRLLDMLNENEELVVKIHGHSNGNAAGKIIGLPKDSKDFFKLTSDNPEGIGSAKKLSEERAETIKKFLSHNGISEKRMQVKSWGGKKPVYDKRSENAKFNVRVEIEILKN
ncbi:MAG: OmpA family protein [Cyclobacteriaceae bacterium]